MTRTEIQVATRLGMLFCLALAGCKPAETTDTPQPAPAQVSPLVAGAEQLNQFMPDLDPRNRELVLSQSASTRRDWTLGELRRGYRASAHTNEAWDLEMDAAFEAFAEYTRVSLTNWPGLEQAVQAALATGSDDPMLQYMNVRYLGGSLSAEQSAAEYVRATLTMAQSRYHPLFKFMSGFRAAQAMRGAEHKPYSQTLAIWTTLHLEDLARDTNAPIGEVIECSEFWLFFSNSGEWLEYVSTDLLPILEANWGHEALWHRLEAEIEVDRAWDARGGGYADTVSEEGWILFKDHLDRADQALTRAWQMNTNDAKTAYLRMRVELGQGRGEQWMRTWFDRAMALNTNYYDAVSLMSFYLEPRWYGSEAQTLAFARSCVNSDRWGGEVPLILPKLHASLARYYGMTNSNEYWQRSVVWSDVQAGYEKFFQLNPDAVGWRHDYAMDAFRCGKYQVFLDQLPLFTFGTNHAYFDGEARYREMVTEAQQSVAGHGVR